MYLCVAGIVFHVPLFHLSLASGVAAVSGGAVFVIIAALALCVVVALVVKLRGTCKQRVEVLDGLLIMCMMW